MLQATCFTFYTSDEALGRRLYCPYSFGNPLPGYYYDGSSCADALGAGPFASPEEAAEEAARDPELALAGSRDLWAPQLLAALMSEQLDDDAAAFARTLLNETLPAGEAN